MFDAVRNNRKIVQIFLVLICLPFALWGVDSYVHGGGAGEDPASVGDTKITAQQFQQAWRQQQDRLRQALGANYKSEEANTPEARLAVLNSLIDQRLLALEANQARLGVSDEALRNFIARIPSLQENGAFSMARYEAALSAQGLSQPQFEAQLRQDLTLQQLVGAVGESSLVAKSSTDAIMRIEAEERQASEFRFPAAQYSAQASVDAAAVKKFYDENARLFQTPERARAEYVVLSQEALLAQVKVADEEVKAWYDGHKDRYQSPEERRASHILLLDKDKDPAKTKAAAEAILREVQAQPAKFAEIARSRSQDPGSANKGGDLGFFARGMMVKAFDDAAFKLKDGEVSGVVQSEFGYHIIKLTGIHPGKQRSLEEVRPEIVAELKRQASAKRFAEAAEAFSNMVYEQADSLKPAAERFGLKVETSGWLAKAPKPQDLPAYGVLGEPKLLKALFADDAVKNKRNTDAIEIAPNTLVAARVVEYQPAAARPLTEVSAQIESGLKLREAAAQAKKAGEAKLAELQKGGEDKLAWSATKTFSRLQPLPAPPAAARAVFQAPVGKLPAFVGVTLDNGDYALYRVAKVSQPEAIDEARRKAVEREYSTLLAQEDFAAYLAALRARTKVEINQKALEASDR
ncbi:SurA N-terminal domain-containing protein [Rhodocyclus tenuis]|uniref:SurA N-terminal domain-containing protein n=1 Tax=Rhodocyclus tenuis TaxID=1066 RepID=UPI0019034081|nr:SurA N-terminal domain-containing protein [Rhodocyclus tenuis]MBK1679630.1 peptidylprolyl isomerase [Rhodocyclus tenuis]